MESMEKTEKIYYEDAYLQEFTATVLSADADGRVVLDRTAFFPESGGQTCDRGVLVTEGGELLTVKDVQITGEVILHLVETPCPLHAGDRVTGRIDWAHRFDNMQNHSGEHIFSGLVHSLHGYNNVGFHLSETEMTMDFDGVLTEADLKEIEGKANEAVWKNVPVLQRFPGAEELETISYRSKKEVEGALRLIVIPDIDICACCAPHVRHTGEIGVIKLLSAQNYKGGTRVSVACGSRALAVFAEEHAFVTETALHFSTSADQLSGRIAGLEEEIFRLKGTVLSLNDRLIEERLAHLPGDREHICILEADLSAEQMRHTVNALMEKKGGYCGVFAGSEETGYRFVIGIREGDARIAIENLRPHGQVKGGGNAQMVQGSVTGVSEKTIREVWDSFTSI
ncbi:MAG: alanyl-tRNA editing protein [Lachnospiraceae bacterium]|nr:alanyl-tRNA editing protein [Lachnospiraceae bacterium]